mgnify:CR=1 FL=1
MLARPNTNQPPANWSAETPHWDGCLRVTRGIEDGQFYRKVVLTDSAEGVVASFRHALTAVGAEPPAGDLAARVVGHAEAIGQVAVAAGRDDTLPMLTGIRVEIAGEKVLVLKPETYMNESGRAVGEAARFLKIELGDIVVFHDALDLAPGKLRVKIGGGNLAMIGFPSLTRGNSRAFSYSNSELIRHCGIGRSIK